MAKQKEGKEGKRNTVRKNTRRLTQCPSVRNEGKNAKARIKGAVVLQPPSASTEFAVADELWNETPEIGVEGLIATLDDNILLLQGLKKESSIATHEMQPKKALQAWK